MGYRHRLAGLKDGECGGIRQLGCVARGVLHPDAGEAGTGAVVGGNGKGVGGKSVQGTAGVVEELDGLVASVGESSHDLEILHTVDRVGAGDLEGEAGSCGSNRGGGCESEEGGADGGGEHDDVEGRGRNRMRLKVNEPGERGEDSVSEDSLYCS